MERTEIVPNVDTKCVDSVRCLAAALPQQANSGHPGAPMGCAPMAHVLWSYIMNYSPKNPNWINRDRFVLSNGHGCALHYSMLHLLGYPMTIDDLKSFRQLNSATPGHPEAHTAGIEVTTGPLGQGISQAVGLAMASHHMAAMYNKSDVTLFDNFTYVICGDGCLQEGVASEACSLAGHLKLGRLIVLYDKNQISIDGDTDLSFTEDVAGRFTAYGWHVQHVGNGDGDLQGIKTAVETAKSVKDKPSIIIVKTTIGYGSVKEGTEKTHGAPLGQDDLKQCRRKFGFNDDIWSIDPDVKNYFLSRGTSGDEKYHTWLIKCWQTYITKYPNEAKELERRVNGLLPEGWEKNLPVYTDTASPAATRALSHAVLNSIANIMPEIIGGSADLTESNKSDMKGVKDFMSSHPVGRYIRYGVREHAMAAIVNGLFAYGGIRPYGATFLNFITYAWGAVRLAALSNFGVLHIATHDSIELGEDGPTHQPVEVLPLLRSTPNLLTVRPCDGTECAAAYKIWIENRTRPTVMALCRSNVPNIPATSIDGVMKGGYILEDFNTQRMAAIADQLQRRVVLAGSGSEVHLCVAARQYIEEKYSSVVVRVVSMPCWELFDEQLAEYRAAVLPPSSCKLYCEASSVFGWDKYFNLHVGMKTFGMSAPKADVMRHFGFTKEHIAELVAKHLNL